MSADLAVTRRALKQIWIGAIVWALVFGATVAASALTYASSFPDAASRQQLVATTGNDTGFAMLLGPVSGIGSVGGYTTYKCYAFLTAIGAIWGLLVTTRLLRGEEDSGRWQLVLAGTTDPRRATVATLRALGIAVTVVFAGTALGTALAGRSTDVHFGLGESVLYGLSIAIAPAVFIAVGALTSQLSRTRRLASGLGMGVFGVTFLVRMIADSGPDAHWLRWLTPFGWSELMRPLTANNAWPLVPAVLTVAVLLAISAVVVARRDVGDGVLSTSDVSPLRPFGLRSPVGLIARLELPVLAVWCIGAAVCGLVFGIIAKLSAGSVPTSVSDVLDKFGVHGAFAKQYLGVAFLYVATVVALLPASQIGAALEEETSGRLVHVLSRPAHRRALLGGRLVLSAAAMTVAALLAGLAAWAGAKSQGVDLEFAMMVRAGVNVLPTALVVLGIGAVMLSIVPSLAAKATYGVVIWSLLADMLGSLIDGLHWLDNLSLFHYMALAPAQEVDAVSIVVTLAVAVVLCVAATLLFDRRDVQTG